MRADTSDRVRVLERILASGGTAKDCHQHARREWGIADRTARSLIAKARDSVRQDWEIERPQMVAELLSQLSTLQIAARKAGQYHVALGCINTAAKLARLV